MENLMEYGETAALETAYRRGKAAGYTAGVVDGWDACMKHVQRAFDAAVAVALKEPETVRKHREAVLAARNGDIER